MTRTYYLTGHNPERYNDLLAPLIELRINDMDELLTKLRMDAGVLEKHTVAYDEIESRYKEIEKAKVFWLDLKYEGDVV